MELVVIVYQIWCLLVVIGRSHQVEGVERCRCEVFRLVNYDAVCNCRISSNLSVLDDQGIMQSVEPT